MDTGQSERMTCFTHVWFYLNIFTGTDPTELRRISAIRPFLTTSATATLVCSRVLSRIDYCNSLLAGVTSDQIARHQRIQNNSPRLIFRKRRSEHVRPMLISLHWLPIKQRIEYKLATLAFPYIDGTLAVPLHLTQSLLVHSPQILRSSSDKLLCVPRVNMKTAGARSFRRLVCGTLSRYKPDSFHFSHLLNPA